MPAFDEFRVVVQPGLPAGDQWTVRIDESPIPLQVGKSVTLQPALTKQQLEELRQTGWTDVTKMKGIGKSVWESVFSNILGSALDASAQFAAVNGRRLRLVMVRLGAETETPNPAQIGVAELPFEALCHPVTQDFFAIDTQTPVSRGLQVRPDRPTEKVTPPLRVLLFAAEPKDKANVQAVAEVGNINGLLGAHAEIQTKVCVSGLYDEFRTALRDFKPHVVHFAGHGGYAVVGDDPNPRPHLCFVRPDNGNTFEVDADTLGAAIKHRAPRLVVLTACASAAPGPAGYPYRCRALEGIAQRLVIGGSGVSAAIAMQFDIESTAAETFSREFYKHLLDPNLCLDEAVTLARLELSQKMTVGHRAWVNPTVFWRCVEGRVFELETSIDPNSIPDLPAWDARVEANLEFLTGLANDPVLGAEQANKVFEKIREAEAKRSELLRQCIRLSPETAAAGTQAVFKVLVRTASPGVATHLSFRVVLPDGVTFISAARPDGTPVATATLAEGTHEIVLPNPSMNAEWPAGEREVVRLRVAVAATRAPGLASPVIDAVVLQKNHIDVKAKVLNPILFVHRP